MYNITFEEIQVRAVTQTFEWMSKNIVIILVYTPTFNDIGWIISHE